MVGGSIAKRLTRSISTEEAVQYLNYARIIKSSDKT